MPTNFAKNCNSQGIPNVVHKVFDEILYFLAARLLKELDRAGCTNGVYSSPQCKQTTVLPRVHIMFFNCFPFKVLWVSSEVCTEQSMYDALPLVASQDIQPTGSSPTDTGALQYAYLNRTARSAKVSAASIMEFIPGTLSSGCQCRTNLQQLLLACCWN